MSRAVDFRLPALTTLLAIALLAIGCGEKPSAAPPAAKERDALAKQLAAMSPEQRSDYMRQHPEALRVLSGTGPQDSQP